MTVQEAVAALGEGGAQRLFDAHVAGKVTLVGWRRGSSSTHGPLPVELFANAVEIEPQTNSIVPSGDIANFGEFERNYWHLDRWDDVKVKRAEFDALKNVQDSTSPDTSPLAQVAEDAIASLTVHERINAAIQQLASEGMTPGQGGTVQWDRFCDTVRNRCSATVNVRGFSDKSIKRCVTGLKKRGGAVSPDTSHLAQESTSPGGLTGKPE
jgi:hypothetical protein